mgnify:CR=1 FL=1
MGLNGGRGAQVDETGPDAHARLEDAREVAVQQELAGSGQSVLFL